MRRSHGPKAGIFPLELCRPLLKKRGDALHEIFGCSGGPLRLTFQIQLLLKGMVRAGPIEPPRRCKRECRSGRQAFGKPESFAHQLRIVKNTVNQTPLQRGLGRKLFSKQGKFACSRQTDEPRQQPCRPSVRHQSDACEGLKEIGRSSREDEIAHQRDAHPDAGGGAIDCSQKRDFEVADDAQQRMIGLLEHTAGVARTFRLTLGGIGQIGARTESAALASEDDGAKLAGILDPAERVAKPRYHRHRCSVHHFGMVHRQHGDLAVRGCVTTVEILAHLRPLEWLSGRA